MNSSKMLKIMLKSKKITTQELQSFFQLNKEGIVELLINFLEKEIDFFDINNEGNNKYLFYALDTINEIYSELESEGKKRPPYYQQYNILKQELYNLSHYCKKDVSKNKGLSLDEEIYLEIYYYKNIKNLKKILENNSLNMDNNMLIENIINSFINSLKNDKYSYYKKILNLLIEHFNDNPEMLFHISHLIDRKFSLIIDSFPKEKINNLRETEKILSKIHTKLVDVHRKFDIVSTKKPSTDRPYIFTIDEYIDHIKEDAISIAIENDNIYVTMYIIDPTDRIIEDTDLFNEAIYNWFEKDSNHLLDSDYSKKQLSLEEGQARKVIAFEYCFNKSNQIKKLNIFEDRIRVNKNYTYDQVTNILNKDSSPKTITDIDKLCDIANDLKKKNKDKNKYHLLKQLNYYLENNKKYETKINQNSCIIISELKILTNYTIARLLSGANIPCIYRNNKFMATDEQVEIIKNSCNQNDDGKSLYEEIQNINIESWYSNYNEGHYGLHLEYYIHASTPVRNFFSLINLKILKDIVMHKKVEHIKFYNQLIEECIEKQQIKVENREKGIAKTKIKYKDLEK